MSTPNEVKHLLDETIHIDLESVQKSFRRLFYKDDDGNQVLDEAKIPNAIGSLAYMRELGRQVEVDYKAKTEDLNKQLKPYQSERSNMNKLIDEMDKQLVGQFTALHEEGKLGSLEGKGGAKLIPARKQVVSVDETKLPAKYFKRVPDMQAIEKALEEGDKIAGIVIKNQITWRTKLPEDVEVKS